MKSFLPVLILLLGATNLFAADAKRPNIVLLYADDLGFGDVSSYGAKRISTPQIDRCAQNGLRFTDAHCTASTCTPSRYALITGEYAWRKKGTGILPGDANLIIEPGRTTIASVLKKAGYTTGIVGKWHLGLGQGKLDWNGEIKPGPLELGFDYCFLMPATGDRCPCVYLENHHVVGLDPRDPLQVSFSEFIGDEPTGKDHPELLKMKPSHGHNQSIVNGISRMGYMSGAQNARWKDEDMADTYVKKATAFIEQHKKEPFFLELATHDIHVPRVPNARFAGKSEMGARGDVTLEFDWCIGEIISVLERNHLAENTLVIISSDNGPVVDDGYQDGSVEKLGDHKPAGPWRGGKYSIYEGGTRVPFIVYWPGRVKPGVSEALISQVDFVATFAALTEQSFDSQSSPDSQNVLPALLGDSSKGREILVEQSGGIAVRKSQWKYIPARSAATKNDPEFGGGANGQLYDLAQDPAETKNLAVGNPAVVKELQDLLQQERARGKDATAEQIK